MLGIFVITFNTPADVLICQLEAIKKFCKEPHEVLIFDNSSIEASAESINYHSEENGAKYVRLTSTTKDPSQSHAWATNLAFKLYGNHYSQLLYLDHDCIPIKPFECADYLYNAIAAGIGQGAKKTYFWPGCLFLDLTSLNTDLIDFSVCREYGLDTGGMLYKLIEGHIADFKFLGERYVQNEEFDGKYNFYTIIDEKFMHFVNTSNWNGQSSEERINSLVGIARKYINGE